MKKNHHQFGVSIQDNGSLKFKVWAPNVQQVELNISSPYHLRKPMIPEQNGVFTTYVDILSFPVEYTYILDGYTERADPASTWQPMGVNGPSKVCDHTSFKWNDEDWTGLDLKEMIIYELHVGTYTAQGTFKSVIDKIPHLKQLGINTIELMPIATFAGERNWGYDGVLLYAPQESYGGPIGLKQLVNACHQNGIAVILDVVYNHFGPEGNHLEDFGPYFTSKYTTPWGKAINYDGEYSTFVRDFIIENAIHWLKYFHIDGLRLDAIHGIFDQSAYHILEELRDRFAKAAEEEGRQACLIAESDLNDPKYVSPQTNGGCGLDAQWNDDFHHSVHSFVTGSRVGYFEDYGSVEYISKALTDGFVYDGIWSNFRKRYHGKSSAEIPGFKMVNFIQNHDQIANASHGLRLASLVDKKKYLLASTLLLLSPSTPLLFMGQEWATKTPFYFFTDFEDTELQEAVRKGRLKEYSLNGISEGFRDPGDIETFRECLLDWNWNKDEECMEVFRHYQKLIALRKDHPALNRSADSQTNVNYSEEGEWITIEKSTNKGDSCIVVINFSESPKTIHVDNHVYQSKALYSTENIHQFNDSITLEPLSFAVYDSTHICV